MEKSLVCYEDQIGNVSTMLCNVLKLIILLIVQRNKSPSNVMLYTGQWERNLGQESSDPSENVHLFK